MGDKTKKAVEIKPFNIINRWIWIEPTKKESKMFKSLRFSFVAGNQPTSFRT